MEKIFIALAFMAVFAMNQFVVQLNTNDASACDTCQNVATVEEPTIIGMAGVVLEYNGDVGVCAVQTPDGNVWEYWCDTPMTVGDNVTIFFQLPYDGSVTDWKILDVV